MRRIYGLRRRIRVAGPEEEPAGVRPHGTKGRKNLARARRHRLQGVRGRRPQREDGGTVPAAGEGQARRDGIVLLHRVQVEGAPGSRQREGDEGSASRRHDGCEVDAVRRQAHGLRRFQGPGRRLAPGTGRRWTPGSRFPVRFRLPMARIVASGHHTNSTEEFMFRKIAVSIGILVAGILAYAATRPDTFRIERTTSIKTPPEKIFPLINGFRQWESWSPWEKIDP